MKMGNILWKHLQIRTAVDISEVIQQQLPNGLML